MYYKILIFSDSKWRDLPGTVLLKLKLKELLPRSIIEVCSFNLWKEAIEFFNPHLVILNHIQGRRNKMIANYVKRHNGLVVVQFNEGIVEFDGKANIFKEQKDRKDVDLFLCWNDIVSEMVDGVTVGCPRFDIYKDPYNKLIDNKTLFCNKHNLDPNKPIVVFGDSWPSAKFAYSMKEFHQSNWTDLKNTVADKWKDAGQFAKHQYDRQELFKFIVKHAAVDFKDDVQVVVSTHPMSDFTRWQLWGKTAGVHVIGREYIFNILSAADVYVGKLGSIAIAESWLLNTPAVTLGRDYDSGASEDQYEAGAYYNNVEWDTDYIHVVTVIDSILNCGMPILDYAEADKYLQKWGFGYKDASIESAWAIVNLLNKHTPVVDRGDYVKFSEARVRQDRNAQLSKMDGFGNWDKTVTQMDVRIWESMIRLFIN